jgi:DNA-binding HxlR family transcriptional regulator
MSTVTKRWLLLVLNQIGRHGRMRYNELLHELHPISPKALADVLKEMQDSGLLDKNAKEGRQIVVEYSLSGNGKELRKAIIPLLEWATANTNHRNCPILSKVWA